MFEEFRKRLQAANISTHTPEPSRRFKSFYDDDDDDDYEESTNPLPPSILFTTSPLVLPIEDPEESLIMGDEDLNTIPEKETGEVIKSSVEDLIIILSEAEDTSGNDSECDLPSCDAFSPIDVSEGKSMTFSNPIFDLNDDFTSSDDESLSDEDVPEDNVLENIENKDSYYSNLDALDLLVTPLFDANEDECFDPGGDIDEIDIPLDFKDGYYDTEGHVLYLESLLSDNSTPNLPPEEFLDRNPRSLSDIKDLKIMVKVFDLGIPKKILLQHMIAPDYEDSHARGFVHRLLELQSLAYGDILDLIDLTFIY
nr:hypothetical protein [Tanacetum cinerariifolium]